jgi:FixJ family two-component response regulator
MSSRRRPAPEAVAPKTKQILLVVDDDASLLRAMQRLLRSFDYKVVTFHSAEDFLAFDVPAGEACLLLDIFLPGMSGIELCSTLAAAGRSIPTVLMTAHDDEGTRRLAGQVEVTAVLYKPFDEEILLEAITRAFASS